MKFPSDEQHRTDPDAHNHRRRANGGNIVLEWASVVLKMGPLSAIALYTAYMLGQGVPAIQAAQASHQASLDVLTTLLREHATEMREHTRVLYQVCIRLSKDQNERDRCIKE